MLAVVAVVVEIVQHKVQVEQVAVVQVQLIHFNQLLEQLTQAVEEVVVLGQLQLHIIKYLMAHQVVQA